MRVSTTRSQETLTIYTYESLLAWGIDAEAVESAVYDQFELDHGVTLNIVKTPDAIEAMTKLYAERDDPVADVIIGVDNTMIFRAIEQDLLESYIPSNIADIDPDLIEILDPDHYVVPYDYGLIALIYKNASFTDVDLTNMTLQDIIDMDLDKKIVTSNPLTSSTGLGFLLWTIVVHEKILNTDWVDWWKAVSNDIMIKPSWSDAWTTWDNEASGRPIMVSYGTDPAYHNLFAEEIPPIKAIVSYENDQPQGWLQVEGIGLVKNAPHPGLAKTFIDWFLNESVQQYMAENNWMFPANTQVELPASYDYAIDPSEVNILNLKINRETIKTSLDTWLDDWEVAMTPKPVVGFDIVQISSALTIIGIIVIINQKRKKV
ncbi:MAG: thiamine ABC transporter substrate-binding protein [Candidatus Hodarchaeales archaeon]|jgi:thiamine transport system substrate-binding protein